MSLGFRKIWPEDEENTLTLADSLPLGLSVFVDIVGCTEKSGDIMNKNGLNTDLFLTLRVVGSFLAMVIAFGLNPSISRAADDAARHIDEHEGPSRVLVLTDIGNEPDDQMSLVRFLLYSNEMDVEGIVVTTSTWQRDTIRQDIAYDVIEGYAAVEDSLRRHDDKFPTGEHLRKLVLEGQPGYGMSAVGDGKLSPGAQQILTCLEKDDPRPLWISVWGGANTLAQALWQLRDTTPPEEVAHRIAKLRVYSISDQDDAGPWIRAHFPDLFYIVKPSTANSDEYATATWTGIAGDRKFRNGAGADFTTVTNQWLDEHIRSKGPLGERYPRYHFIMEGDTPSFLHLIRNGLGSYLSPAFGGWGGRYVHRQPYGETSPLWTQGGSSFSFQADSRDTVVGVDGNTHTSDQATIWRWRRAFQHDFAVRMDWTILPPDAVNHRPEVTVNGVAGRDVLRLRGRVGETLTLDATGTTDPDGDALTFHWFYYREAGFPEPVRPAPEALQQALAGDKELWQVLIPGPLVELQDTGESRVAVKLLSPGEAHVILQVEDDGELPLTSYRRVILSIADN